MKEFSRLLDSGLFTVVPASEAKGLRVYGSRFVDGVKHEGKPQASEKFLLGSQAWDENDRGFLLHAPAVHCLSWRLLLALCAMDSALVFFTHDVSQAYVQSETSTQRPTYVRPPETLKLPYNKLLSVDRSLYGIFEADLHSYQTYHNLH